MEFYEHFMEKIYFIYIMSPHFLCLTFEIPFYIMTIVEPTFEFQSHAKQSEFDDADCIRSYYWFSAPTQAVVHIQQNITQLSTTWVLSATFI